MLARQAMSSAFVLLLGVLLACLPAAQAAVIIPGDGLCAEPLRKCQTDPQCMLMLACYRACGVLPPFTGAAARCSLACKNQGLKRSTFVAYNACLTM